VSLVNRGGETVHRGRWTRDDRAAGLWPRLPFEVPARCAGVSVELSYDRGGGTVLDLGCEGAAGWRGWSGGARRSFVITPSWATPGYLPGKPEPGVWHVVLGLHRVPAGGVEYVVRIGLGPARSGPVPPVSPEPPVAERPPRRELPAVPGMRWLACDFHAHTVHSDGGLTVPALAARAASRGLDVLAVTDHNTVSHHAELPAAARRYGVHLLPGQEVTTDTGHANAFGALPWVDFRQDAAAWRTAVDAGHGLLSMNHPLAADCGWLRPLVTAPPALAEVWHWSWLDRRWNGPITWWRAAGLHIVPIGGSDFHHPDQGCELGAPVTWIAVPVDAVDAVDSADSAASTGAVLDALRAGRTSVSPHRNGPVLLRLGDELVACDAGGALLLGPDGARRPVRSARAMLPAAEGGHILIDPDGAVLALCA
jgi:PHP domain